MNKITFPLRLMVLVFFSTSIVCYGQQIERAEYFIDIDPGQGKGKVILVNHGNPVEFSAEIETTNLSPGVHTLFTRVKDDNGVWGLVESQSFYLKDVAANTAFTLIGAEYFFDNDPGFGNGTALSVTPNTAFDFNEDILLAGLENGIHTIYVRVQDSNGSWSLFHEMPFYLQNVTQVTSNVSSIEYFIDNDPGVGSGTSLTHNTTEFIIPTDNLSSGIHKVYIRAKNNQGVWGMIEERDFLIEEKLGELSSIVSAEYFIDNKKPIAGTGTALEFESTADLRLETKIEAKLPEGVHSLSLQLKDSKGTYSIVETREFTVAVPRIDEIKPNSGGNIGDVTVSILGASFDISSKVLLRRSGVADIVVTDSMKSLINGDQIMATFDLRGSQEGIYDVVVTLENGNSLVVKDGFEIKEGIKASPWAEIIGFDRIRRGQWQTYTISYGNRGNVDANGVPLWLVIGQDTTVSVEFDFEISSDESHRSVLDSIQTFFTSDSLFGERYVCKVYPLYVTTIRAGTVQTLNIRIRANNNFQLLAYATPPFYRSPFSENLAECLTNVMEDEIDDLADAVIPGASCVMSLFEGYTDYKKYMADAEGAPTLRSLMWDLSAAVVDCGTDFIPVKTIYRFSKALWRTVKVIKRIRKEMQTVETIEKYLPCAKAIREIEHKKVEKVDELEIKDVRNVASFDPNDKIGSSGAGTGKYVSGDEPFQYLIRFENKATATAAAQTVLIVDSLDTDVLDLNTLELTFFNFGKKTFNIPPGRKNYITEVDLRPENNLILKVDIKLNEETGILKWTYSSIDPYSRLATEDPDAGFLPPNVNAPEGEGGVFFTIRPKETVITNSKISNKAYIYFDANEVIPTPPWSNTLDKDIPESKISALPELQNETSFELNWEGNDKGAGIKYYSIYYSKDNGPFDLWLDTISTKAIFTGDVGSSYRFYSNAVDSADNFEQAPLTPDAQTRIQMITSIEQEILDKLQVFPNPANSILTIKRPENIMNSKVFLVSPQGYVIRELNLDHDGQVDISQFQKGLFFLSFDFKGRKIYKKVIFE